MTDLWTQFRRETPGADRLAHFNNAGAALSPAPVIDAVKAHLDLEMRLGGYEAGAAVAARVQSVYADVGAMIGAEARNIALTASATDAYARALSCIAFERGDLIIIAAAAEYASNQIQMLSLARRFGVVIEPAPRDGAGAIDIEALARIVALRRPRLVTAVHMNTSSGAIADVAAIGRVCRAADTLYLVDGCQTFGWMAIDVAAIGCDFFSATSRKFMRGPRGAGVLYVSDRVLSSDLEPLFIDLRGADLLDAGAYVRASDAKRFEDWEFSIALVLGLGAAARYALDIGLGRIEARVRERARATRARLDALGDWRSLDGADAAGPIIALHAAGRDGAGVAAALAARGVNAAYIPRAWAPMDAALDRAGWALRVSPHYYTSDEDIDMLAQALKDTAHAPQTRV